MIGDRFEIVREIGQGSNGAVYEVIDRSTGRPAALKVLVGDDADLAGRLEREGKALAVLAHPHVVALVDAGTHDGRPYVATELIRGVDLRTVLGGGGVAPLRALAIVRQLLEALEVVHAAGMIHRDIKPENIMLGAGDDVKLFDFGVAKVIDPGSATLGSEKLTRVGLEVIGSPPYIAPEIAAGYPIDARTDLYSVGIVLYELLAGHVPFQHDDPAALLRKHITDPVPKLRIAAPDTAPDAELEALVMKALAKVPDERFASATAMHAAVRAIEAHAASRPALPPRRAAGGRAAELLGAARRHPRLVAAIGTAVAVLVLWLAVSSHGSSHPVESASVAAKPTTSGRPFIDQGNDDLAHKRWQRAVTGYERALVADRSLGGDAAVHAAIKQIANGPDAVAAVVALDVLATRVDPPDRGTILELAASAKLPDVKRRAQAIAERDGFAK